MKYLILCSLFFISALSTRACECYDLTSFCNVLDNSISYTGTSKIVCYAEYTVNHVPFGPPSRPWQARFEMKIIDLFFGEVQPGSEGFLNTDSTFWVIPGENSCQDLFVLEEGDYAIMAPSTYSGGDYDFFDYSNDKYIYPSPLGPSEYNDFVRDIETCLNAHCEKDLTLSNTHWSSYVYQGSSISSTSVADGYEVIYKAKDRVSLKPGFKVNDNRNFRVEVGAICN